MPLACRAEPNSFTYAALIKAMSESGRLDLAEQLYARLGGETRPASSLDRTSAGTMTSTEGVSSPDIIAQVSSLLDPVRSPLVPVAH